MNAATILAHGAALPRLRLPATEYRAAWGGCSASGLKRKAFCAYDEDPVTLAVAAARLAFDRLGTAPDFDALFVGATVLPYEEKPSSATIVSALTARRDVRTTELRGSPQAGLQALLAAAEYCKANPGKIALAVAADAPAAPVDMPYEHALGAGAAAFVVSAGDGGVAALGADAACTVETFGGRFRRAGSAVFNDLELRTQDDADAIALLAALPGGPGETAAGADALVAGLPPRVGATAAKRFGAKTADEIWPSLGDAGAASAPLALADALDRAEPGERVLALAVGAGAVALQATISADADLLDRRRIGVTVAQQLAAGTVVDYVAYLKHRRVLSSRFGENA